ncbi:NAD(P)H-binding protein [Halobacillus locisalis]|uniref:NAD(P)H-binding protein n=2 Tax=Halobacillus locisalis TaxID=220753 RepID=A0A838CSF0_9BACI|nr:NAD(P)H-binding protein [Halobacillus locisalis]
MKTPVIALTGANGNVGRYVIENLKGDLDIVALSVRGDGEHTDHVTWRACDVYSLSDIEAGIEGADVAVYLMDSMLPKATLTQGSPNNLHMIATDNFAKAAKNQGVKHIIHCSNSIPLDVSELSEIEEVLRSYGTPVTTIRSSRIKKAMCTSFIKKAQTHQNDVRSVQRIPAPRGWTADDVALHYVRWLGEVLNPVVQTTTKENHSCQIGLSFLKKPLIEMVYDEDQSTSDLAVYSIRRGLLVDTNRHQLARFEFRKIPRKPECMAAIHDYVPSLPWPFYRMTQAFAHRFIMAWFRFHMSKLTSYR